MELKSCPFCAEEIKAAAVKCKHCGSNIPVEIRDEDKAGAVAGATAGGCLGLGMGVWVGGAMVLFGFALSMTGIGAVFGVPLIIGGFISLIAMPLIGGLALGGASAKEVEKAKVAKVGEVLGGDLNPLNKAGNGTKQGIALVVIVVVVLALFWAIYQINNIPPG